MPPSKIHAVVAYLFSNLVPLNLQDSSTAQIMAFYLVGLFVCYHALKRVRIRKIRKDSLIKAKARIQFLEEKVRELEEKPHSEERRTTSLSSDSSVSANSDGTQNSNSVVDCEIDCSQPLTPIENCDIERRIVLYSPQKKDKQSEIEDRITWDTQSENYFNVINQNGKLLKQLLKRI